MLLDIKSNMDRLPLNSYKTQANRKVVPRLSEYELDALQQIDLAAADLDGDILGIGVVHQIFEGQHHIVCGGAFRHAVVIVIDSNEADPHKGKNFFQVFTGFDIVPSEPGEVLDYHTICCAGAPAARDPQR